MSIPGKPRQLLLWVGSALAAAAWLGLRVAGVASGLATAAPEHQAPGALSLLSSAVLAAAAWCHWGLLRGTPAARLGLGLAVGMSCGLAGDAALSQTFLTGLSSLVGGLLAFGAGHASYLAALKPYAADAPSQRRVFLVWGVWVALALVAWQRLVLRSEIPLGPHTWVVLAYAVLLASVAGLACALALGDRRFAPVAAGAALFLVSDLWIGINLFSPSLGTEIHARMGVDMVWMTYGPAQVAIVYTAVVFALGARGSRERAVVVLAEVVGRADAAS